MRFIRSLSIAITVAALVPKILNAQPASPGVYSIQPGVTIPKVVQRVQARYTRRALRARIEGTVTVEAVVRADGQVTDVKVLRSLDPGGLDDEAVKAAKKWRFEPGTKDGAAVAVRVVIEQSFWLKK